MDILHIEVQSHIKSQIPVIPLDLPIFTQSIPSCQPRYMDLFINYDSILEVGEKIVREKDLQNPDMPYD